MITNPTNLPRDFDAKTLSLEEAEDLKSRLLAEIQDIQAQLGDRERPTQMDPDEYETWRSRAKWALTIKQRQYRDVKDQVKRLRADTENPVTLLRQALDLLKDIQETAADDFFETHELDTISRIESFFGGAHAA